MIIIVIFLENYHVTSKIRRYLDKKKKEKNIFREKKITI